MKSSEGRDEIRAKTVNFISEVRNCDGFLKRYITSGYSFIVIISMVIGIAIGKWYGISILHSLRH